MALLDPRPHCPSAICLLSLSAVLAGCAEPQPAATEGETLPTPAKIHNGSEASSCQWPMTAVLRDEADAPRCSATLIHPSFVLTAAHCLVGLESVGFGEDGDSPIREHELVSCIPHPDFEGALGVDLAVCELAEPVNDVPIVPMMMGCEQDALVEGALVTIVGYGNTQSYFNEWGEFVWGEGIGPKRYVDQVLHSFDLDAQEVHMIGVNEDAGGCHGDSGGSSYIQLADGTWRLFGVAQSLFDASSVDAAASASPTGIGGFVDPTSGSSGGGFIDPSAGGEEFPVCGTGTTYSLVAPQMAWIEEIVGSDVSPCFTADGAWDPNDECMPFPLEPQLGAGDWAQGCVGPVGGSPQCELLGTSTGTPNSETGTSTGTGTGTPETGSSSGAPPAGTGAATTDALPPATDSGDSDGAPGATPGDSGCGCSTGSTPWASALAFVVLGLGWTRRRAQHC